MKKKTFKKYKTKKKGGQHYWINYGSKPMPSGATLRWIKEVSEQEDIPKEKLLEAAALKKTKKEWEKGKGFFNK